MAAWASALMSIMESWDEYQIRPSCECYLETRSESSMTRNRLSTKLCSRFSSSGKFISLSRLALFDI